MLLYAPVSRRGPDGKRGRKTDSGKTDFKSTVKLARIKNSFSFLSLRSLVHVGVNCYEID